MSMQLKRKESLAHGLRRVYRRHLSHAMASLDLPNQPDAIHVVRKEIKAMRALMRLGRDGLNHHDYKKITRALRLAAKSLSAPRDALVTRIALEQISRPPVKKLRPAMKAYSDREQSRFAKNKLGMVVGDLLRKLLKPAARLKISSFRWKEARLGLKKSYQQGRRAFLKTIHEPTPENLHEWRKCVKHLYLQLAFLSRDWPRPTRNTINNLQMLGDCLGTDHDFVLLEAFAREQQISRSEKAVLSRHIRTKRQEYQQHARRLGARIYQAAPAKICRQLERDWKTWRRTSR
jgi:CHAD domain-containing protein